MNRVAFNIFGFNVYYYSLCILLGVIVAYILITREGKKQGLPKEFISDLIFYTLIIGILGARVYYCVFNLDYYLANPSEILKIYLNNLPISKDIDYNYLAKITNNYNGADIKEFCEKLKMMAIKESLKSNVEHFISMKDVYCVEKKMKTSVPEEDILKIKEFEKYNS